MTGEEALDAVIEEAQQGEQFEIVLMDYQLHDESNGLELLEAYRGYSPDTFLGVLITAEQDPDVEQAAYDAGFRFLAKPVEPAKLRSILHTALLARQQARDHAAP